MKINTDDEGFGAIINCAVRYAFGRATYMPYLICSYITPIIPELDNKTLHVIKIDIAEYDKLNDNRKIWQKLHTDVSTELQRRQKT